MFGDKSTKRIYIHSVDSLLKLLRASYPTPFLAYLVLWLGSAV